MIGLASHICYLLVFTVFINEIYVYQWGTLKHTLLYMMTLCLMYPMLYDMTQLRLQGFKTYFSDKWNYFD